MRWTLLVVIALMLIPPPVEAGPPDSTNSSVSPWDSYGRAFVCPGATNTVDLVTITVLDNLAAPVVGATVTIDLSNCNSLCIDTPSGLSGITGAGGVVTLNPRVGGCEACSVTVWANGIVIREYDLVVSPDWDGVWADGVVDRPDSLFFASNYTSPPKPYVTCSDFDGDGLVNLLDFTTFGVSYGATNTSICNYPVCQVAPTSIDYGYLEAGAWKDTTFTITNVGVSTFSGDVSETCTHFNIISGGGPYTIAAAESVVVGVRFQPVAEGPLMCDVSTGSFCSDVSLSGVAGPPLPTILSILDVPNDQGREVRIIFSRSLLDSLASATPILQYEAFRRIDELPSASPSMRGTGAMDEPERARRAYEAGMRSDFGILTDGWDYAGAVPAHAELVYNLLASTQADSTITYGMHWSVFFIRAATALPAIYYDSAIDSGYSLDNLSPAVPGGLIISYNTGSGNNLDWEPSLDADFQYFRIYRSTDPNFIPAPDDLVHATVDDSWLDTTSDGWQYTYKVTAVDFAGNESGAAVAGDVTSIDDRSPVPETYALYQNTPNPFNPTTSIRYDVPAGGGRVTLEVFDVAGRLVRTLVDGRQTAGRKTVDWNAEDAAGHRVASGVYFYRLRASNFEETRKMVLLE